MNTNREILDKIAAIPVVQELIDELLESRRAFWNPIDDDGQALNLAVHLGIDIIQHKIQKETVAKFYVGSTLEVVVSIRWDMMDKICPTTRLAIVEVAAEIAKMQVA